MGLAPLVDFKKMLHIGFDIIELFHILTRLLVGGISRPLLRKQSGVFLPERFHGRQLFYSKLVKVFLRRLMDQYVRLVRFFEFFAVICVSRSFISAESSLNFVVAAAERSFNSS